MPAEKDGVQTPVVKTRVFDAELESNRQLWSDSAIRDYDMEVDWERGSGIGGPANNVFISVRNGTVTSISSRRSEDTRPTNAYQEVDTVEKLFRYTEKLIEQNRTSTEIDANGRRYPGVSVKYDSRLGYPSEISILWSLAADAGTTISVRKLSPLSK